MERKIRRIKGCRAGKSYYYMQKADFERRTFSRLTDLQTGKDWQFFPSSSCFFGLFTFLTSQSSSTRTPGLGLHEGLGNFGHGGSVGHTGGLDRTDSICISVEGGASTGTTA